MNQSYPTHEHSFAKSDRGQTRPFNGQRDKSHAGNGDPTRKKKLDWRCDRDKCRAGGHNKTQTRQCDPNKTTDEDLNKTRTRQPNHDKMQTREFFRHHR